MNVSENASLICVNANTEDKSIKGTRLMDVLNREFGEKEKLSTAKC